MFEEDPAANLRICLDLAPRNCDACGDFHISVAVRRTAESNVGMDFDRDDYVALLALAISNRIEKGLPLTVLIAGAADTAIYHLVLEAALVVGGEEIARRLDLTVVDLCETPLEMCRQFAARHSLKVTTARADIGDYEPGRRFGVIAMHGVLPFFPEPRRLEYLERIGSWLDREGTLVSAIQINETVNAKEPESQIVKRFALLDAFVAANPQPAGFDIEDFRTRMRRAIVVRRAYPKLFADVDQLIAFHEAAHLEVSDLKTVKITGDLAARRYRQRAVIACRRKEA